MAKYSPHQLQMIRLGLGLSKGAPPIVRKSLLEAMAVESGFRNLHYGDRDSQGVLQQRPSTGWGPPGNAATDIKEYLRAAIRKSRGFHGSPGQLAQAVQGSAFPGRYDQHAAEVNRILGSAKLPGNMPTQSGGPPMASSPGARQNLAVQLIAQNRARSAGKPDTSDVMGALREVQAGAQSGEPLDFGGPSVQRGASGSVTIRKGADRAGVSTSPAVLNFIKRVSGMLGRPLTLGTGTNHSRLTVNGNQSAHWTGHAGDVPLRGGALIRAGQDALIAAGMPPKLARKQRGGLFNIGGWQVIFNTQQGGDHTDHLHVGQRG